MIQQNEKRKKIKLDQDENAILKSLFVKALFPIAVAAVISSAVIFLGLHFLIKKVSFGNYGLAPASIMYNVSQFIVTYIIISLINFCIMISLSIAVIFIALRNIILPLMRIIREVRYCVDNGVKKKINVRSTDKLLIPLASLLNRLLEVR
jgi:hypothetical protein